jgi:hypothetical protein
VEPHELFARSGSFTVNPWYGLLRVWIQGSTAIRGASEIAPVWQYACYGGGSL